MKITLRTRLVLLLMVGLVPLLGLSLVRAWSNAQAVISMASHHQQSAISLAAAHQERVLESARQILMAIASAPGLVEGKNADCQRYLRTLKDQFPVYATFGVIGLDGYMLCHSEVNRPLGFFGDRDYFQAALARRSLVTSGYLVTRATGEPVIVFARPVTDREEKDAAVAFATVGLDEISKAVAAETLPPASLLVITDRQGIVLAVNPNNPAMVGQRVPSPFLRDAVKTMRAGVGEAADSQGLQRIFAFMPIGMASDASFLAAISSDKAGVLLPVWQDMGLEFSLIALLAFLGGWIAWRMGARAIMKPAAELLEATRQVEQGRLDLRIPISAADDAGEFSRIAAGFNRMAESLQSHHGEMEAELARSQAGQEKLQDAQRLGRIGYWQSDLDTRMVWWSDEVYDVLGVDRALLGNTYDGFLQWIHPDDREAYGAGRDAAVQAGMPRNVEYRVVTSAGEVRWIHQFGRAHVNAEGEQGRRRAGVIQDVTERKLAELAIARNTELLNRTGVLAKVGGWELARETMTPFWSDEIYRIHELEPGASVALEDVISFYAPEAQPVIRAAVEAGFKNASSWDLELPMLTARGRRIWVRTQGCALLQDGKVVRLVGAMQDITEQHEAQEQMRLLETCIFHLNDMVVITEIGSLEEPGNRIVFVNDAFELRTGYSRQEVLGQSPRFLRGPNTQRAELDRIDAALKKWQPVRAELINYTKSGEEYWVELDIVPIADATGRFAHWVAVERDITGRRLAEQALMDSEQRYAALFEAAPVPMWLYDIATTQFLAVNHAATQSYGYSAKEFGSMTIFDIRPESACDALRQELAQAVGSRRGVWQHRRKDGSVFPVAIVSQPIVYAGRAARFIVALDVSAQVKAEKEVAEYLFTLQRAADAAQAITWHQTLQGTLQEVAEQARGVIGAHQAAVSLVVGGDWAQAIGALSLSEKYAKYRELIEPMDGSGIHALVSESNRALRLTQAELEAHPRWRGFGRYADKHPPMRGWLAVPLTGRDGKNIGLLQLSDKYEGEFTQPDEYVALELAQLASSAVENARLIEEINQINTGLEQKIAERTLALRLANQELEAFSYSVSHDLRSPLNTIDGFSQLLAKQLAKSDDDKARHYLSRIRAGTKQMGQLIGDLLALAQVSRVQMQHEPVDLSALARNIADDLQARQPSRQVALQIETGLLAEADAGLLRVVLENLLGNAWKFSSKQPQTEISVGQQWDAAGQPVFFVRDNGAGFDMAYADKLFLPFQRLHAVAEFAGTGIGLATVSRVIERHGGRLWADAAPGRGATFFFTLPKVALVV